MPDYALASTNETCDKAMINKAFDHDKVSGEALGVFKKVKKKLKKGSDVRDRILSPDEFKSLMNHAKGHTQHIIAMGYYTGMRKGEILSLTWDKVDLNIDVNPFTIAFAPNPLHSWLMLFGPAIISK